MENSKIVFVLNDDARAMMVSYEVGTSTVPAKAYLFKTLDQTIDVGDYVVIPTDTRHGFTVGKVEEADVEPNLEDSQPLKWIVDRVDRMNYENVLRMEREAIAAVQASERRRKKAELRENLFKDQENLMTGLALTHVEGDDDTPVSPPADNESN